MFLDVDGVLANWRSQMMTGSGPTADRSLIFLQGDPDEAPPLERSCVEELASLCRDCNATVILSSTWRVDPVLCAFLRRTLEGAGVAVGGATPHTADATGRGGEILRYLRASDVVVDSFVILDDEHAESFELCELTPRFARTKMASESYLPGDDETCPRFDPGAGLTREVSQRAKKTLERPLDASERAKYDLR